MNIYEITGQLLDLQDMAESGEFDWEILKDTMESVEGEFETKAEGYAKVMRNLEASAEALKTEERRLADRRRAIENSVNRMKETLKTAMIETGKRKFDSGIFKFSIAKNGGKAPLVLDCIPEELPPELSKTIVEPDNDAIRRYLQEVGESQWAHFGERGESLRIK